MYDVIIVGAGIAGATAAYFLCKHGLKVLVLDKEKLPRYKPCAGGIPHSLLRLFPFSLTSVVEREVFAVRYSFQRRMELIVPFAPPVVMVMRNRLDYFILQQSGAEVAECAKVTAVQEDAHGVTVSTDKGSKLTGRYLVAADGANSIVARALGLRRKKVLGVALEAEVPADDLLMRTWGTEMFFSFGLVKRGYLWVFPKRRHLSVGIGTFGKTSQDIKGLLLEEMAERGLSLKGIPIRAHPLPAYRGRELLHTHRAVLVGDAAGLVDPLLGEGIRYAVWSALIATQSILDEDMAAYTCQVHKEIGMHLNMARLWAWLFYRYPRASFELGVRNPYLTPDMIRMFNGNLTYGSMLLRIPKYVWGLLHRLEV